MLACRVCSRAISTSGGVAVEVEGVSFMAVGLWLGDLDCGQKASATVRAATPVVVE
jgi:hypothetical protein